MYMKQSAIHYDKQIDAIYISLKKDKEARFEEVQPNITVEYDNNDQPIGIEILNAKTS